mmetsp:Transcript_41784/g.110597  ORF Transcript_41784/g.110597 Transcript_41784/m.110597 type:complete len:382 (-) Transcript_41784:58-1203(-)
MGRGKKYRPLGSGGGGNTGGGHALGRNDSGTAPQGLRRVRASGDGNCLFHALAYQTLCDARLDRRVREDICCWMEKHLVPSAGSHGLSEAHWQLVHSQRAELFPYNACDDSVVKKYVQKMRRSGEWGTGLEAMCAAYVYQRPVLIWSPDGFSELRPPSSNGEPVRLLHNGSNHWDSLVPAEPAVEQKQAPSRSTPEADEAPDVPVTPLRDEAMSDEQRLDRRAQMAAAAEERLRRLEARGLGGKPSQTRSKRDAVAPLRGVKKESSVATSSGPWPDDVSTSSAAPAQRRWGHRAPRDATVQESDDVQSNPVLDLRNFELLEELPAESTDAAQCVAALMRVGFTAEDASCVLAQSGGDIVRVKELYCIDWDAEITVNNVFVE